MAVTIYGKPGCPYTDAAMQDFDKKGIEYAYVDVKANAEDLATMLKHSGGARKVPVIVEGDMVTVGFGGS